MHLSYPRPFEDSNGQTVDQDALPSEGPAGLLHLNLLIQTLYESIQEQLAPRDREAQPFSTRAPARAILGRPLPSDRRSLMS